MVVFGRIRFAFLISAAVCTASIAVAQELDIVPLEAHGVLLDALMTEEERTAWTTLTGDAARAEFVRAFWADRDPTPGTSANERRDIFVERAQRAIERFAEGSTPGYATDRGRVMLVFGLPDEQELRAVPTTASPTLTWYYRRHTPVVTVRFAKMGAAFLLDEDAALSNTAFLRSLGDELRLRLATAVGNRHGALVQAEGPAVRSDDPTDPEPDLPPPAEVAPEVKVWMETVSSGVERNELEMRRRLYFFPAQGGTYTALTFELGKEALEFVVPVPAAVETFETESEEEEGESDAEEVTLLTAAEVAAAAGLGAAAQIDPLEARADLRVFGAFLQGDPGRENTMHSFLMPYELVESAGDADSGPSLSLGVTLFPGAYRLVWGVFDATTGMAATRDETVQVPDYAQGPLSLTRPVLAATEIRDDPRPMNTTTVYQGIRLGSVLVANDVDDAFDRDATVEVVAIATGWVSDPAAPGKPRLEVTYRILEGLEGDESLARLPTQLLDFHVLGQQIPLGQVNRLRSGRSYRIEVRVKDLVGGRETVQRAPLHLRAAPPREPEDGGR